MNSSGNNIRLIRTEKEMSQQELAEKAFMSRSTLSKIESGVIEADDEKKELIAQALGVDKTMVFTKSGNLSLVKSSEEVSKAGESAASDKKQKDNGWKLNILYYFWLFASLFFLDCCAFIAAPALYFGIKTKRGKFLLAVNILVILWGLLLLFATYGIYIIPYKISVS